MKLKSIQELTIGQYIDCIKYLQEQDCCSIALIMYGEDLDFHKQPYRYVIEAVKSFQDIYKTIHDNYSFLFDSNDNKDEEYYIKNHPEFITHDRAAELEKERQEEWNKRWSWYNILFNIICGGNVLKMDQAYKMPLLQFFNHLSFLNSKN